MGSERLDVGTDAGIVGETLGGGCGADAGVQETAIITDTIEISTTIGKYFFIKALFLFSYPVSRFLPLVSCYLLFIPTSHLSSPTSILVHPLCVQNRHVRSSDKDGTELK